MRHAEVRAVALQVTSRAIPTLPALAVEQPVLVDVAVLAVEGRGVDRRHGRQEEAQEGVARIDRHEAVDPAQRDALHPHALPRLQPLRHLAHRRGREVERHDRRSRLRALRDVEGAGGVAHHPELFLRGQRRILHELQRDLRAKDLQEPAAGLLPERGQRLDRLDLDPVLCNSQRGRGRCQNYSPLQVFRLSVQHQLHDDNFQQLDEDHALPSHAAAILAVKDHLYCSSFCVPVVRAVRVKWKWRLLSLQTSHRQAVEEDARLSQTPDLEDQIHGLSIVVAEEKDAALPRKLRRLREVQLVGLGRQSCGRRGAGARGTRASGRAGRGGRRRLRRRGRRSGGLARSRCAALRCGRGQRGRKGDGRILARGRGCRRRPRDCRRRARRRGA
mmetsp:Transcript_67206/g.218804  ORF Transcript_67206/g.218804 Transcript_67206/m.218804 type:complete len:388 (+) Transcript_67206:4133-5296(+)